MRGGLHSKTLQTRKVQGRRLLQTWVESKRGIINGATQKHHDHQEAQQEFSISPFSTCWLRWIQWRGINLITKQHVNVVFFPGENRKTFAKEGTKKRLRVRRTLSPRSSHSVQQTSTSFVFLKPTNVRRQSAKSLRKQTSMLNGLSGKLHFKQLFRGSELISNQPINPKLFFLSPYQRNFFNSSPNTKIKNPWWSLKTGRTPITEPPTVVLPIFSRDLLNLKLTQKKLIMGKSRGMGLPLGICPTWPRIIPCSDVDDDQ